MPKTPSTEKNHFANNIEHGTKEEPEANLEHYFILALVGLILAFLSPIIGGIIAYIAYRKSDSADLRTRSVARAGIIIGIILFVMTVLSFIFDPSLFNNFKTNL
jgi:uncharacterized membrane protein